MNILYMHDLGCEVIHTKLAKYYYAKATTMGNLAQLTPNKQQIVI